MTEFSSVHSQGLMGSCSECVRRSQGNAVSTGDIQYSIS
ncbi:MAG: hypothetical protein ACJAXA_002520, partial [Candidatus Aldehydirespiratoraceae bacterium]